MKLSEFHKLVKSLPGNIEGRGYGSDGEIKGFSIEVKRSLNECGYQDEEDNYG